MKRRLTTLLILGLVLLIAIGFHGQPAQAATSGPLTLTGDCAHAAATTTDSLFQWVVISAAGQQSDVGHPAVSMVFDPPLTPGTIVTAWDADNNDGVAGEGSDRVSYVCGGAAGGASGFLPECGSVLPKLGTIAILPGQSQPAFDGPGGAKILVNGQPIMLPGSPITGREFTVISKQTVKGSLWLGLWDGSCLPMWVPAAGVTLLTPLG